MRKSPQWSFIRTLQAALLGAMSAWSAEGMGAGAVPAAPTPADTDTVKIFNVLSYGAQNDGQTDAQAAIAKAIGAAKNWTSASPANKATVYFPAGTYSLTQLHGVFAIPIDGAKNLTVEGASCSDNTPRNYCVKLIGAAASFSPGNQQQISNTFFSIINSQNISISNFYLDKVHPYFTQGTVVGVGRAGKTMDLHFDTGYSDFTDPYVSALLKWIMVFTDPQLRTWDHSDAGCADNARYSAGDLTCHPTHILAYQQSGNGIWRVTLDQTPLDEYLHKPFLMWRNINWQSGFVVDHASDVTISNIFYTGGGGPGVHMQGSDGANAIRNFVIDIPAGSGRLFSATSGFNGTRNRGSLVIDKVSMAHTDDDGFHFAAGNYYPVLEQSGGDNRIRVGICYDVDFRPGDQVQALNWATKAPIATAVVVSSQPVQDSNPQKFGRACDLVLDKPLPSLANLRTYDVGQVGKAADANDRIVNLSIKQHLTVSNSILSSMRAHCGIVQVAADITNNTCQNVILSGLLIGPEFNWGEGYAVDGVRVVNNRFDNVSGTAIVVGDILNAGKPPTYAQLVSTAAPAINFQKDNRNIVIQGNTFSNLGTYAHGITGIRGVAISIENADGVRVIGNHMAPASPLQRDAPVDIVVAPSTTSNVTVDAH